MRKMQVKAGERFHGYGEHRQWRMILWMVMKLMMVRNFFYCDFLGFTFSTYEAIRIEWTKSRARTGRWSEDVKLTVEEMRRVLVYMVWKANWWLTQANHRQESVDADLQEGLVAYAHKQASVFRRLGAGFAREWSSLYAAYNID